MGERVGGGGLTKKQENITTQLVDTHIHQVIHTVRSLSLLLLGAVIPLNIIVFWVSDIIQQDYDAYKVNY